MNGRDVVPERQRGRNRPSRRVGSTSRSRSTFPRRSRISAPSLLVMAAPSRMAGVPGKSDVRIDVAPCVLDPAPQRGFGGGVERVEQWLHKVEMQPAVQTRYVA